MPGLLSQAVRQRIAAAKVGLEKFSKDTKINTDVTSLAEASFHSNDKVDQQIIARMSLPAPVLEMYQRCEPPPPLNKMNPFRDDGVSLGYGIVTLNYWNIDVVLYSSACVPLMYVQQLHSSAVRYFARTEMQFACDTPGELSLKFYTDPDYFFRKWMAEQQEQMKSKSKVYCIKDDFIIGCSYPSACECKGTEAFVIVDMQ